MENFSEIMTLVEAKTYLKIGKSTIYLSAIAQAGKMAREGKIPAVKIEFGENNKVITRVPYNQELIKKIKEKISFHSLGHSFAIHLLESGTDLRYIQELLEHVYSKKTEIYTHVCRKNLGKIVIPIDTINLNKGDGK